MRQHIAEPSRKVMKTKNEKKNNSNGPAKLCLFVVDMRICQDVMRFEICQDVFIC